MTARDRHATPIVKMGYWLLALAWAWFLARVGVEWSKHAQFERRRIEEAKLLVETMCSTALGANLANEFAKCEDAHVTVANGGRVVWLRAFEKTVRAVSLQIAHQVGCVTVGALAHALVFVIAGGGVAIAATFAARKMGWVDAPRDEYELLSPIAQARLQSSVRIGYLGDARDKKYD
ncbi:MAG: hypothetical protein CMI16_12505 [Opitutaceae bacterium]|nr:hypothetical protein [Opitutaceae bacterium]